MIIDHIKTFVQKKLKTVVLEMFIVTIWIIVKLWEQVEVTDIHRIGMNRDSNSIFGNGMVDKKKLECLYRSINQSLWLRSFA